MKDWLIRTKGKKILGPVSRDKVLELFQKSSLKPDDEICVGNGFWFRIKETEYVQRYLIDNAVPDFNPISEAENKVSISNDITLEKCLTLKLKGNIIAPIIKDRFSPTPEAPIEDNLMVDHLPNHLQEEHSVTMIRSLNDILQEHIISQCDEMIEEALFPNPKDLDYPDIKDCTQSEEASEICPDIQTHGSCEQKGESLLKSDVIVERRQNFVDVDADEDIQSRFPAVEDLEYPEIDSNVVDGYESTSNHAETIEENKVAPLRSGSRKIRDNFVMPTQSRTTQPKTLSRQEKSGQEKKTSLEKKTSEYSYKLEKTLKKVLPDETNDRKYTGVLNFKILVLFTFIIVFLAIYGIKQWVLPNLYNLDLDLPSKDTNFYLEKNSENEQSFLIPLNTLKFVFSLMGIKESRAETTSTPEIEKKKLSWNPMTVTPYGAVLGKTSLTGFSFQFDFDVQKINCQSFNDDFVRLFVVSTSLENRQLLISKLGRECFTAVGMNFWAMVNLDRSQLHIPQNLENHLEKFKIKKQDREEILRIYTIKDAIKKTAQEGETVVDLFNSIVEDELVKDKKERNKDKYYSAHELVKKNPSHLVSKFVEISLALFEDNIAWAKRVIREILTYGPSRFIFDLGLFSFEGEKAKNRFQKNMVNFLWLIKEKLKDEQLYKLLTNYIALLHDVKPLFDLRREIGAIWSINQLNQLSQSINYGRPYLSFWARMLESENARLVSQFVNDRSSEKVLTSLSKNQLWLYAFYALDESSNRKLDILINRISSELMVSTSLDDRYLLLLLLSEKNIKNKLALKDIRFKQSYRQIELDFYYSLLKDGQAVPFAVFNLMLLGESSDHFYWWMLL